MRTDVIDWLGVLATDEEMRNNNLGKDKCFINKSDKLQFYLKVISKIPGQGENLQYVSCYSDRLDEEKIVDNGAWDEKVRIKDYIQQLEKYFFKFNYEENQAGYFRAKNIEMLELSENYYDGKSFFTIPMIQSSKQYHTYEQLELAIKNGEYISKLDKYITEELENIPYIIFYDTEKIEYRVIGNFVSFDFDSLEGIRYEYNELKAFVFEEDWYDDVVVSQNNSSIIFIGDYVHKKIMGKFPEVEAIDRKKSSFVEAKIVEKHEISIDEWEFIEYFETVAKKDGLFYSKKDFINFHTAVKSNSLVILSGLSGTGKSRLVQCYAKALGIYENDFHMIPVRPNWNDDSDLIGFVDSMHMVYRPSDCGFTNVLLEASREENKDKLYLICFDEMNLARVEYYFSQFLSILEMPEEVRSLRLYTSEYESRLYNADKYKSMIKIRDNIRFVGTVNIDESTFHFSDKVLDRANVIQLDIIPYTEWHTQEEKNEERKELSMTYGKYKEYIRPLNDNILTEREMEFIWKVHELLNTCSKNLGVGPRILKQIGRYLVNLPLIDNSDNISRQEGFDIQFVQRIITKIRGQKEQLGNLFNVESEQSLEKLFDNYGDVSKFEKSRKALETKWQEINNYGYTL